MFGLRSRSLFLPLILVLLTSSVFAQRDSDSWTAGPTIEVTGHVRLADGGEPARSVPVQLERVNGGGVEQSMTDHQGKFRFSGLQRGYYRVVIKAPGFLPVQQEADLQVTLRSYLVFEIVRNQVTPVPLVAPTAMVIDARVPLSAQSEFERGRVALAEKKVAEAVSYLEKAVGIYSDFYEAQFLLGTTYMYMGNWEKAEGALSRAADIRPDEAGARIPLGEVLRRRKDFQDAERVLAESLKIDDNSWQAHFTLGRVFWDQGEIVKAGKHLGRTLQLKPDFAEAHLLAGNVLLRVNAPERAFLEFEEYLRLEPQGEFAPQTRALVDKIKKALEEKKKKS
jgi:Tfp pilus assembly protein PilF/5-hydroxyisourate hydrolase-like protein (transthyretin family)